MISLIDSAQDSKSKSEELKGHMLGVKIISQDSHSRSLESCEGNKIFWNMYSHTLYLGLDYHVCCRQWRLPWDSARNGVSWHGLYCHQEPHRWCELGVHYCGYFCGISAKLPILSPVYLATVVGNQYFEHGMPFYFLYQIESCNDNAFHRTEKEIILKFNT